jgi:hypothetical protein
MTEPGAGDILKRTTRALRRGCPCGLFISGVRRPGTVWEIDVRGAYVVLPEPLPAPGTRVVLTFSLPGERTPIAAEGRVRWPGESSGSAPRAADAAARRPLGCAVEFVSLDAGDRERIAACVGLDRPDPSTAS